MSTYTVGRLDRSRKVYVAGHRGLVGSAVWRHLAARASPGSSAARRELDLRDRAAVDAFFAAERPEVVVMAAAKVGGIMANKTYPAEFISDNLRVQVNVLDAAHAHGAERLLFLGSSCIYPQHAAQPITEDALLTGPLEPTNDAYAIAKIAGILHVQAQRRQYGVPYISAMPTNLYGPDDNFDPETAHVLPALIRRFHEAARPALPTVRCGAAARPDASSCTWTTWPRACLYLLESYDAPEPINVGSARTSSIAELARAAGRGRRLRGRAHLGHQQAGRDAAQAAGRLPARGARLEAAGEPGGRPRRHVRMVHGQPRPAAHRQALSAAASRRPRQACGVSACASPGVVPGRRRAPPRPG